MTNNDDGHSSSNTMAQSDVSAILDSHTLPEYLARALDEGDSLPVLAIPMPGEYARCQHFSRRDLAQLSIKAAMFYISQGVKPRGDEDPHVCAIFAPGTIEWVVTFFALARLGYTVFALSPQLSREALASLLALSGAEFLIGDSLPTEESTISTHWIPMVTSTQLEAQAPSGTPFQSCIWPVDPVNRNALITHSSGSTGLPKLLPRSHKTLLLTMNKLAPNRLNMVCYVSSAVYNPVGVLSMLLSLASIKPTFYDNDKLPFTSNGLVSLLKAARPQAAIFTPYSLCLTAAQPDGVEVLKRCDFVSTFGAVCPQAVGDRLVREGVFLRNEYASTEVGQIMSSLTRAKDDLDWDYMIPVPSTQGFIEMRPLLQPRLDAENEGSTTPKEELYECVILPGYPGLIQDVQRGDDPPGCFHTGDTFVKHPSKEGRWKTVGRLDDQLKVYDQGRPSNVSAVLYEGLIKDETSDMVDEVVSFGQGRKKLGVLLFPKAGQPDQLVLESVWKVIQEKINTQMKTRIERKMLLIVPGATVPRTNKRNIIRSQIYVQYQDLIDRAYEQVVPITEHAELGRM